MPYEIAPYTPAFDPQIVQLQTHLWSADSRRNGAYFRWKYIDNPFLDEVVIQLTLFDGHVVAMHGIVGALWQVGDAAERYLVPHTDDLVVAPEHRNRGVATQVMRANLRAARLRGYPFVLSLSAGPTTFKIALAAGWRSVGSYASINRKTASSGMGQLLPNRIRRSHWYRRLRDAPHSSRRDGPFARLDRQAVHASRPVSVSREPRPTEMAGLIAGLSWDGRMRHVRNADYLTWRFRNPLHEYRFLFWDDDALRGYLVLQRYLSEHLDQWLVNIVDWEGSDHEIRTRLLEAALRLGRFPRIQTWTVGMCQPMRTLLCDHGFEAQPSDSRHTLGNGLLLYRFDEMPSSERCIIGGRDLHNIADWDLRMLYSMTG